ncbi:metal tolerance protein 11-like isoform X1 [Pecten maximus]|uniref:metal tolerance protein 11-like isoform X1 n=1 Tax=Pecten maximus TaxID=6579 RepID=UPI001458D334|nr:metal tolerance protein 11-like isoform X1 [Pecten maximus]
MTSQEEHDQPPLSSVSVSNGSALSNGVNGNVNQAFETKDEPNFLTWDCRYSGTNRSSYKCHIKHTCEILGTDNCKRCLLESNLQGLYDRNYNSIVGKGRGDDACVLSLRSHLLTELTGSGKGSGHRKKSSSAPSSIRLPKQKQKSKISKCQGSSDTWKINLDQFKSGRKILESEKDLPKSLRSFYKQQAALIDSYESLSRDSQSCDGRNAADLLKKATFYSKLTFFVNLFLLIAKSIAAGISGSMAIITSLVDSVVDLASGIVLWVTARTIRKGNLYSYPQGRSRLEPLAIIVLSVIMGVASLQLIKESVTKIIGLSDRSMKPPVVDAITIVISITTVGKYGVISITTVGKYSVISITSVGKYGVISMTAVGKYGVISMTAVGKYGVISITTVGKHGVISITTVGKYGVISITTVGKYGVISITTVGKHGVISITTVGKHGVISITTVGKHGVISITTVGKYGVISITTVVVKFVLFLVCRRIKSPTIQALAQDHRNDVISNTLAILCGYIGSEEIRQQTKNINLAYVDPVGAILISLYIAVTWYILGRIQVRIITGLTAKPEFLSKIIWICLNHHRDIRYVTSVKAVHSGYTFVVEVGILLPEDMSLKAAHTIGESLEKVLENTQHVDRVFVHMNCTENDNPTFY